MHLTPIGDGVVLLEPNDGLDLAQADHQLGELLQYLQAAGADRLIYDLKEVVIIDTLYYQWLESVSRLCRLANITMVAANMQPTTAYALALQLQEAPSFACALNVDRAKQ